ncbi:hypothetical protein [Listeria monocytogenes]|uniref:hypothetical protein n=1 Tax=Listeria monocytogenes TaxID=1639 RepID=UPI0029058133|nr:hypothetical protein [Listeria monocytogenes]
MVILLLYNAKRIETVFLCLLLSENAVGNQAFAIDFGKIEDIDVAFKNTKRYKLFPSCTDTFKENYFLGSFSNMKSAFFLSK